MNNVAVCAMMFYKVVSNRVDDSLKWGLMQFRGKTSTQKIRKDMKEGIDSEGKHKKGGREKEQQIDFINGYLSIICFVS